MIARVPHLVRRGRRPSTIEEGRYEAPRPHPADGLTPATASRRPRHRRQGRQDRRPWNQGPEARADTIPAGLRGWPAAPASGSRSCAASRTRSGSRTPRSTSTRSTRSRSMRSSPTRWWPTGSSAKGDLVKMLGRGELGRAAQGRGPWLLASPPRRRSPPLVASTSVMPLAVRRRPARPPRATARQPIAVEPTCRSVEEVSCSPAWRTSSASLTFATRSCSRWSSSRSTSWAPTSRSRASATARSSTRRPSKGTGILGFLNLFSRRGTGPRSRSSGSGSCPTSPRSIIIQLLGTVIPKLAEWRDQGAVGQRKLTQTTRYLTVALALMQSSGLVYVFHGRLVGSSARAEHRPDPELHRLRARSSSSPSPRARRSSCGWPS